MKTGVELITEIAECSAALEQHPMLTGYTIDRIMARREELRKELAELPDTASFS